MQIAYFCPETMVLQTIENVILSSPLHCLILDLNFDVNCVESVFLSGVLNTNFVFKKSYNLQVFLSASYKCDHLQ